MLFIFNSVIRPSNHPFIYYPFTLLTWVVHIRTSIGWLGFPWTREQTAAATGRLSCANPVSNVWSYQWPTCHCVQWPESALIEQNLQAIPKQPIEVSGIKKQYVVGTSEPASGSQQSLLRPPKACRLLGSLLALTRSKGGHLPLLYMPCKFTNFFQSAIKFHLLVCRQGKKRKWWLSLQGTRTKAAKDGCFWQQVRRSVPSKLDGWWLRLVDFLVLRDSNFHTQCVGRFPVDRATLAGSPVGRPKPSAHLSRSRMLWRIHDVNGRMV